MWAVISTWTMSKESLELASSMLEKGFSAEESIVEAIKIIENNEYYKSVGYGGLPNEEKEVELDAAIMNGTNYNIGMVGALKGIENPIEVAYSLSKNKFNNFLVDSGAYKYAVEQGFSKKEMLSKRAEIHYLNRLKEDKELSAYQGHDTVGMVFLDQSSNIVSATSTSGLFMKKKSRIGDSPIIGSGFYADSTVGGAATTGVGEDLMKGVISYEVVRLMKDGYPVQEACEKAVLELEEKLIYARGYCGDLSIVAVDKDGNFGAYTTIEEFSFVAASNKHDLHVYLVDKKGIRIASDEWVENYFSKRTAEIKLK